MASTGFSGATAIESLSEIDTLSSYDFWRERKRSSPRQPELLLLMAVLEDALKCYFDYARPKTRRESKLFAETEQWFFCEDNDALFSFNSVCAFLGIEPDYVRRGLLLLKKGRFQTTSAEYKSVGHYRTATPICEGGGFRNYV